MSLRTHPIVLWARNMGRACGINRLLAQLGARGYEQAYDMALSSCIRAGDVVWDIGANVGYYTTQFAERVGADGRVVAFEPSAQNFLRLQSACQNLDNISLQPCALGRTAGRVRFRQGDDPLGATSQVIDGDAQGDLVEVRVGDTLIDAGAVPAPCIIKMDVEGFEGEVLEGLQACLASPRLRAVGVEVHFGVLEQRGLGHMPRAIEAMLERARFRVRWADNSHILATR